MSPGSAGAGASSGQITGEENGEETTPDRIELADVTDNSPVSIQLGYGLIEMVDEQTGGPLINRITGIRKQISRNLGFVIPAVRVRDDMSLTANQYRLRIGQTIVGEDEVYPDRKLAIPGDQSNLKLPELRSRSRPLASMQSGLKRTNRPKLNHMAMWWLNLKPF